MLDYCFSASLPWASRAGDDLVIKILPKRMRLVSCNRNTDMGNQAVTREGREKGKTKVTPWSPQGTEVDLNGLNPSLTTKHESRTQVLIYFYSHQ